MNIRRFCLAILVSLSAALPLQAGTLTDKLDGELVKQDNGKVTKVEKGSLANKKVIAFYYSAHWCPPCRAFTPGLEAEYAALKAKYPQFELIFVSRDKDEAAMEGYMAWGKMSYPAIAFKDVPKMDQVNSLAAAGIPYMVVVDADGKELAGKGTADWVHPSTILPKLKEILGKS